MESDRQSSARERANPASLWTWAGLIASAGVALRVIWFVSFQHDLPFGYETTASGHTWALQSDIWASTTGGALSAYDVTRSFSPGYGLLLKGIVEAAGGISADPQQVAQVLLGVQSAMAASATLLTFALARRVLFGWISLLPPLLVTASIAVLELPGGLAPAIPLMLLLVLAVWLTTLLRERMPGASGAGAVLLALAAGFTLGAAVLFNPAVLLLAPLILWWAFRGLGKEHATLLLVATILLPACWLVVADSLTDGGLPVEQARTWIQQDQGNVAASADEALDRAHAVATPWNERFARGDYVSSNWNYEWVLPLSLRKDNSYLSATSGLAAFFMAMYVLLVILGLVELFAEGAGSSARLIGLPVIAYPLATFLTTSGDLLRVPILPFLAIALTLGLVWPLETIRAHLSEKRSKRRLGWT